MRVVVALGGNALLKRGEPLEPDRQAAAARAAAQALRDVANEHELLVTHGNGPQVGLLALQAGDAPTAFPLDVLDAESEGMIGYVLEQELANALPGRDVVTLLTRVRVDEHDPAFDRPSKPIGPIYDERTARALVASHGWAIAADGHAWRRVVASPEPQEILPLRAIEELVDAGMVVVCAGGGGIPVVRDGNGVHGVAAVIDKDLASELLAEQIGADMLVLCTDQPGVFDRFGDPDAQLIGETTPCALQNMHFAAGSMAPKVEAVCRFVSRTGGRAAIGALADAAALVTGSAGTQVYPNAAVLGARRHRDAPLEHSSATVVRP
jgi:carbamate kinase